MEKHCLSAIIFTDIVGCTAKMEALEHLTLSRALAEECGLKPMVKRLDELLVRMPGL